MTRSTRVKATRRVVPGELRADATADRASGATTAMECVLVAPYPEWVALDLGTGSLVRAPLSSTSEVAEAQARGLGDAGPLESVVLSIAPGVSAWDPARPEAVAVESVTPSRGSSRRSVRRLLSRVAGPSGEHILLGTVGPSIAYADLTGIRPSVAIVLPSSGVRIDRGSAAGGSIPSARFTLGKREHTLPLAPGAAEWVRTSELGSRRRRGLRRDRSVMLTVGLGPPTRGQVRKMVLGIVPLA